MRLKGDGLPVGAVHILPPAPPSEETACQRHMGMHAETVTHVQGTCESAEERVDEELSSVSFQVGKTTEPRKTDHRSRRQGRSFRVEGDQNKAERGGREKKE